MDETHQLATPKKVTKQDIFLENFAIHGNVSRACRTADIHRSTVLRWKEKSDGFLHRYQEAKEEAKDNIRYEIYRRALEGWDENVFHLGKFSGVIHKYSDTLLIFHAKMLMPEYRDKQHIDVSGNMTIVTTWGNNVMSDDEDSVEASNARPR